MKGVLFLCTGNACRSQMAEGFARRLVPPGIRVVSGGTQPKTVDVRAVAVMAELGIDIGAQYAKSLSEVPLDDVSHVVTLCGEAAEQCPVMPDRRREHWPIPDPARAEGSPDHVLQTFRAVRDEILVRVQTLAASLCPEPAVGVIGGSGSYDFPGLTDTEHVEVETPFGPPSASLVVGRFKGRRVAFLACHGEGHRLLPSEVNARANVYALKHLGVTKLVSVSAVGSVREQIAPGHVVLPRQFLDRTVGRPATFFGEGVVAHVSLADPVCGGFADTLTSSAYRFARLRLHAVLNRRIRSEGTNENEEAP